jgi:transposase-like protein
LGLIQKLPESCLDDAIEYIGEKANETKKIKPVLPCPHCKESNVTKFGVKRGRQRYRCKECRKTFVETTNTTMYHSHSGEAVWRQVIKDTVEGVPLNDTAASVKVSNSTAFRMRHKVLLSLEDEEEREPTVLDGVCELDDTYVLESLKGSKIPCDYWRKPRKHGAKAQKRGISNEYISISTGIQRDGKAISETVTRATPGKEDIAVVFDGHIEESALVLCDGSASYNILSESVGCAVKNIFEEEYNGKHGKGFFNINTANCFHSFIKNRYNQYRGVATKYLNRYNQLFSKVFRCADNLADVIWDKSSSNNQVRFNSVNDVKTLNLLYI